MKTTSLLFNLFLVIVCFTMITTGSVYGQLPKIRIPVILIDSVYTETGAVRKVLADTCLFGFHPDAIWCRDTVMITGFQDHWFYSMDQKIDAQTVTESEYPPPGADPTFYYDIQNARNAGTAICGIKAGISNGSVVNIHPYISSVQKDTFKLNFKPWIDPAFPSDVNVITFKWPSTLSSYFTAARVYQSGYLDADMLTATSARAIYDEGMINVRVYITGPLVSPGPPDTLNILSPAIGATNQDTAVTLSWQAGTNSRFYRLQFSADPTFATGLFDTITQNTTYTPRGLKGSKTYYWRVYYENEYGTSFFHNPPANFTTKQLITFPSRIYPDSADTTTPTPATFRWHPVSGSGMSYHLQVATDTLYSVSSRIKDTTITDTSLVIGGLQNCKTYYWRISASGADGTSEWSGNWRFKIIPTTPGVPVLSSPADNATGVILTPTVSWTAGDICNYSYHLQVAKDAGFTNLITNIITTQTSVTLAQLDQLTDYYWHVKSINTVDSSAYSTARKFTTILNAPSTPVTLLPANGDSTIDPIATIRWRSTALTTNYHLQVSTSSSFSSFVVNDSTLTDTMFTTSALSNCVTYYWHVRSKNAAGGSLYSATWNFKVKPTTPAMPSLTLPADNATDVPLTSTLSWSGDVCSYRYHLQVAKDTGFTVVVVNSMVSQASSSVTLAEQNQLYYWRVKAVNPADSSDFTPYRTFRTVLNPPGVPTLVSPASGDTNLVANGSVVWRSVPYAAQYRLQIAADLNFTTILLNDSTIVDTSYAPSFLLNCKTYYWRVLAKNAGGSSAFSSTWNFKVRTAIADPPGLIYPANNQDSLSENVTLRWNKGSLCTQSYRYEVSRTSTFTDLERSGQLTDTTVLLTALSGNVYYYWHVMSVNYLGTGAPSTTFMFHTTVAKPEQPILLSPVNGASGLLNTVLLQWDSAAFAKSYKVQVALDSAFTNLKVNDSSIVRQDGIRPSKTVTGLLNSTTYYWRAVGKNELGDGTWSAKWHFTTLYPPAAPTLNLPTNYQEDVSLTPLFDWSMAQRANIYELTVAKDPSFSVIVFDDSAITLLSRQIGTVLKEHTIYYWKVRGKNDVGWGTWSETSIFTTKYTTPANWLIPLTVKETGPAYTTIYFGLGPGATRGIDTSYDEYALPPIDPWYFDARFVSPYIGEGLLVDVLQFVDYAQIDTFQVTFQPGLGTYPVEITWPQPLVNSICDSMVIKDQLLNPTIRARMDHDSVLIVTNSMTRSLYIVSYGPLPLPTGVKPIKPEIPRGYVLYQNYPNPFNPTTHIAFSLDRSANVELRIYDMLGRELVTVANQQFTAGTHSFEWNGKDRNGNSAPSGVYYLRMSAVGTGIDAATHAPFVSARKMIMLK